MARSQRQVSSSLGFLDFLSEERESEGWKRRLGFLWGDWDLEKVEERGREDGTS